MGWEQEQNHQVVITIDQISNGSRVDYGGGSENEEKYAFVVHIMDIRK